MATNTNHLGLSSRDDTASGVPSTCEIKHLNTNSWWRIFTGKLRQLFLFVWSFCILQPFSRMRKFMPSIWSHTTATCITFSKCNPAIILYIISKFKWKQQRLEILLADIWIYFVCLCTGCQNSWKICIWESRIPRNFEKWYSPDCSVSETQELQNVSPLMFLLQSKAGQVFKAL